MKKSIAIFAVLFSMLSIGLSSCDKESENDDLPGIGESSYTLTVQGVSSTTVQGDIVGCKDGYFSINGYAPNGDHVAIQFSEILVGETRNICDVPSYANCVDNGGFLITAVVGPDYWEGISGTATRTSEKTVSVSGIFKDLITGTLVETPFTLEVTAGLISPVNCK